MSSSAPPTFSSLDEELSYWKERALSLDVEAQSAREELEEFQVGSRELEAELEAQLEQSESRLKELRSANNRLQLDNDQMRDKLEQCQHEYRSQIGDLQSELTDIRSIRDQLATYVRNLEQQNDDLERAKRSTLASLEDFEVRLNAAIERNAFLESELDEKESLKAAVQRMKDETRDLKSELRLFAPRHPTLSSLESPSLEMAKAFPPPDNDRSRRSTSEANNNTADSNKLAADCEPKSESASLALDTPPSSARSSPKMAAVAASPSNGSASHPLTPSARISALNIVGDLLRKVGALELKLVSCRNIVREQAAAVGVSTSASGSPVGTPTSHRSGEANGDLHHHSADRLKRIPRGVSTPSLKKIIEP